MTCLTPEQALRDAFGEAGLADPRGRGVDVILDPNVLDDVLVIDIGAVKKFIEPFWVLLLMCPVATNFLSVAVSNL